MEIAHFYHYEHYQDNSSHLEVLIHLHRVHALLMWMAFRTCDYN